MAKVHALGKGRIEAFGLFVFITVIDRDFFWVHALAG
jgi:hypothetical protein